MRIVLPFLCIVACLLPSGAEEPVQKWEIVSQMGGHTFVYVSPDGLNDKPRTPRAFPMTDHQMDVAEAVEGRGWGRMVVDMADLPQACASPHPAPQSYRPAKSRIVSAVRDVVERVAAQRGSG